MFEFYYHLPIGAAIESVYLTWKSEKHRLTPKCKILRLLVPLIKHYHVDLDDDYKPIKIMCKCCNAFLICSGNSGEILYTTFLHYDRSTLGL